MCGAGESPFSKPQTLHTLVPKSSLTSGAPSSIAARGSVTAGSGSQSTSTSSAASLASTRDSATTTATPSPAWRALSLASGQCSPILMSSVTGHAQTSGAGHSSARSAPLNAATHPSIARAFETSTPLIFACANGLRTTYAQSIPGTVMSSTNRDRPVISSGSSLRGRGCPMNAEGFSVVAIAASYAPATAETALTMFW